MRPEGAFLGALLVTVAFLGLTAWTGRRRRISWHLASVAASLASLAAAIALALRVGEHYDLESAGRITPVHLFIARLATVSYVWPLVTGPLAWFGKLRASWHRLGAWIAIALTVAATVTGAWMLALAERIAD